MSVGVAAGQIVPIAGTASSRLVTEIAAVRAAGGIPLVGDDRLPAAYWTEVCRVAETSGRHHGEAWATLTSGSTGSPRVVLRTEASWSSSFPLVEQLLELDSQDVLYLPAPPSSSLSLFSLAHAEAAGIALSLPRGSAVTPGDFADATLFHGTPRALRSVLDAVDGGAPHRLRAALVGGSHLDASLRERAGAAGIRVVGYYGAAELSFVAVDTGDGMRAFPGVRIDLRDGELWVRSSGVSSRYLSGTGPLQRDAGGWCTVGDRAEWADGRIRLLGRRDDAILTASATVIPAEVETLLREIEGVADAVVLGLPNAGVDELVCAVIERDTARPPLRSASLRGYASARLAPSHLPRRWFAADELPRTVTGKPARAELLRRVLAGEVPELER